MSVHLGYGIMWRKLRQIFFIFIYDINTELGVARRQSILSIGDGTLLSAHVLRTYDGAL